MRFYCVAKLLILLKILHLNLTYTASIHKHTGIRHTFNGSVTRKSQNDTRLSQDRRCRNYAMIPSFVKGTKDQEEKKEEKDAGLEIVKEQIYNELKQSEDVLKGVFSRILDHMLYYAKHKVVNTFLQFYIVNPLGMGAGNLLNSDVNDSYITSGRAHDENIAKERTYVRDDTLDYPAKKLNYKVYSHTPHNARILIISAFVQTIGVGSDSTITDLTGVITPSGIPSEIFQRFLYTTFTTMCLLTELLPSERYTVKGYTGTITLLVTCDNSQNKIWFHATTLAFGNSALVQRFLGHIFSCTS